MTNIFDMMLDRMIFTDVGKRYGTDLDGFVGLSAGGRRVAAYVRPGTPGKKTIVYLHGNGEDLLGCAWGHTDRFGLLGHTVAAVDYPGYGLSEGPFTEAGCYENAHVLYDHLVGACGVRPEDVVVIGCSLGSGVAVELAASRKVGGLVLEAAFHSGAREAVYMADGFGLGSQKSLLANVGKFPSAARIRNVTCPVLSIHGTADTTVPFEQGRELFDAAPNGWRFVAVPGAGHCGFIGGLGEDAYRRLVVEFAESACGGGKDGE